MTQLTDSGSYLRRGDDFPVLVLSQDYELFFDRSGSIQKCLFEPTDMLLDFADQSGLRITFFVDAGMLCLMGQLSAASPSVSAELSKIRRHIENVHSRGHEIGLHIHPHWEDTRWEDGQWDFSETRYQLRDFSVDEVSDIVSRYSGALNELCDGTTRTYRAGGFCIEPFEKLKAPLIENGITVDSSVVPGAKLDDPDKGFDFSNMPPKSWWRFNSTPRKPDADGAFLEIPITPVTLPPLHYWARAVDRIFDRQPKGVIGDGSSKAIGKKEVLRRLAGAGRVSELSLDVAKAPNLMLN